jgi:hypothetical protein
MPQSGESGTKVVLLSGAGTRRLLSETSLNALVLIFYDLFRSVVESPWIYYLSGWSGNDWLGFKQLFAWSFIESGPLYAYGFHNIGVYKLSRQAANIGSI